MSGSPCPVCDRPPGDRYKLGATVCEMWWTLLGRRCSPSVSDWQDCYAHAKPWRTEAQRFAAELTAVRAQLRVAQAALSRHHAAQHGRDMFPDDARIEAV